jgi:hypothetical protein
MRRGVLYARFLDVYVLFSDTGIGDTFEDISASRLPFIDARTGLPATLSRYRVPCRVLNYF